MQCFVSCLDSLRILLILTCSLSLLPGLNKGSNGKEVESIRAVIEVLSNDFARSTQANFRKGGLIGLAATSIALLEDTSLYVELLLSPILKCFSDQESRVRYYATEALYNITKVTRSYVLSFFNEIFDGLCGLYADVDLDVKNGAQLLDRLLKDVVTESENFAISKFIPLLKERIRIKNPDIRQLLIGWIIVLDSVPEIDIVEHLPQFLGGVFDMLSDPEKDIRQQAYAALSEFLREITQSTRGVDLGGMVMLLVKQCESKDLFIRLTALTWMHAFIQKGQDTLTGFFAAMLKAALQCISDSETEILTMAEKVNSILLKLVQQSSGVHGEIRNLIAILEHQLSNPFLRTRLASLSWFIMLLTKQPQQTLKHVHELLPALLQVLGDPEDEVVRLDLQVLALISLNEEYFTVVVSSIVKMFAADRSLLESRGSLIIRQLSVLLNCESIYRAISKILEQEDDVEFAALLTQTMNLILLTSSELFELRSSLKQSLYSVEGRELFTVLFRSWSHNPVATFSLCLLVQAYELASALIFKIAEMEVTVGFLIQIDKLVQLLESPIYIHLRIQLLDVDKNPYLVKSLYGLLMLLPQSAAFTYLKTRLESAAQLAQIMQGSRRNDVSAMSISETNKSGRNAAGSSSRPFSESRSPSDLLLETAALDFDFFLTTFTTTQAKHTQWRHQMFTQHSLLQQQSHSARPLPVVSSPSSSASSAPTSTTHPAKGSVVSGANTALPSFGAIAKQNTKEAILEH